jgi:predicted alpha/beta-fold hydrolase
MATAQPPFRPAWWLPGGHAQTLWAAVTRRTPRIACTQERLELPDGDFVDLVHAGHPAGPTVLVLHGLEGSLHSPYALGMLAAIAAAGWHAVLLHFRGCSGVPNRRARSYHSGDTGDIAFLLDRLARAGDGDPLWRGKRAKGLAAVGFSLGGNALLKYLGERGGAAPLCAAVAVSVPFQLADAADRLARGFSRLYQWRLLRSLKAKVRAKRALLDGLIDTRTVADLATFRAFDDAVTAPLHGFAGVDDYYARSSSRGYLRRIERPTLILHARDDPFMTPAAIPRSDELSDRVELELLGHGGHVGFVAGAVPWRPRYWAEQRIVGFLSEHLERTPCT